MWHHLKIKKLVRRPSDSFPAKGAAITASLLASQDNVSSRQLSETVRMDTQQGTCETSRTRESIGSGMPQNLPLEAAPQGMPIKQSSTERLDAKEYAIGIDFGTTYSCVAVGQKNGVRIIENEYGLRLTRSIVTFNDSRRLIGDIAIKEQVTTDPTNNIAYIKRLIGGCDQSFIELLPFHAEVRENNRPVIKAKYKSEVKDFALEEIASMILSKMKNLAKAKLGSEVTLKAVISVPSCFNDSQRKAIKDAGAIAGLDVMQLLNEPSAAAIAYFSQKINTQSFIGNNLMIFDLGGGYLEVSIITFDEGTIRVKAVASDPNLGGEDFDNNMVWACIDQLKKENGRDINIPLRSVARLRAACEKAKRILSTNAQTMVEVDALYEGRNFCTTITRENFENLNTELFGRTLDCVKRCLRDARMNKQCVDEVVLIGGSSRIPKIQQLLQKFFNGKLCSSINADEAVAYGAAIQAAILSGGKEKSKDFGGLKLQDVTSFSLGLEITEINTTIPTLIPKNTPIPAKREIYFPISIDHQSSTSINVYEHEVASGTVFTISDIPSKKKNSFKIFKASFEVDESGMLFIEATDISTSERNNIQIRKENGGLSLEEIETLVNAEAQYEKDDEEQEQIADALNSLAEYAYYVKGYDVMGANKKDKGDSTRYNRLASTSKYLTGEQYPGIGEGKNQMEILNVKLKDAANKAIAWLDENQHREMGEIIYQKEILENMMGEIEHLLKDDSTSAENFTSYVLMRAQ